MIPDYTSVLKKLMVEAGISNFKQLSQQSGVSQKQILRLRQGKVKQMRVEVLLALTTVFSLRVDELISLFSHPTPNAELSQREQFQRESLQQIESWLLQWPTAVHSIENNPNLSAQRVIKLLNPIEKLIASWGVTKIGQVGETVNYNPQQHQLLSGNAQPGEAVKVRYVGYKHGEKLLYRSKVAPID